jgi:hypothetical protein
MSKPIPNYAEKSEWPAGAVPPDRAYHVNRRPTAAEERDEAQSKLISMYAQDAEESGASREAAHAHEEKPV